MKRTEKFKQSSKSKTEFSVITVVYQIDDAFWATAESVASQMNASFEWIVKPAIPIAPSDRIRLDQLNIRYRLESGVDSGIYSAMNIATDLAEGDYLFFLNSGDRFANFDTLQRVRRALISAEMPLILYGGVKVGEAEYNYPFPLSRFFFFRNALCHQAYFISRCLCEGRSTFDEEIRVLADHDLVLRKLELILSSHHRIGQRVATVPEMGFSARNVSQKLDERRKLLAIYFPFRKYFHFYLFYALTFPRVRAWLFGFSAYQMLRRRVLGY